MTTTYLDDATYAALVEALTHHPDPTPHNLDLRSQIVTALCEIGGIVPASCQEDQTDAAA